MIPIVSPYQFGYGYRCDAADFDGANDYMLRGSDLTGAANSKSGIFSAWVRLDAGNASSLGILRTPGSLQITRNTTKLFHFSVFDTNSINAVTIDTVVQYIASATWLHVLASWDVATAGSGRLYISDVSDYAETTFRDATLDYTQSNWAIGAATNGAGKFDGAIADLYFAPGQYLDFSVESNRRKFISATGKPVSLGPTGAAPTGVAPIIFLHLDNSEAVANFATNRGTGGDFTITGTLETASTSQTD